MRWWAILGALIAFAFALAPAAFAQDDDEADDEPVPTQTPAPGCERGPGTDADYLDCPEQRCDVDSTDADYAYACCPDVDGTDADYAYACPLASSGPPQPQPQPTPQPRAQAVQALGSQTLPLTGGEPPLVALAGLGLLLAGAGLRLRAA